MISSNGIQQSSASSSTSTSVTIPNDFSKYKALFGISSFSIDNNILTPRSYVTQMNQSTGEVYVNTNSFKFNLLTNNYLMIKADDCAGCLGYGLLDSASNACVAFCPTNSYVSSGACVYCAPGQHLSGNTCITCGSN